MAQLEKKQAEVIRKYYFEEKTWPEIQYALFQQSLCDILLCNAGFLYRTAPG